MQKYLKANIREDQIRTRRLKITYKGLSPEEKRLVKKAERWEQLSQYLDYLWGQAEYEDGGKGKVIQETMNWAAFHRTNNEMDRIRAAIARLETRYGLSENIVMKKFNRLNSCRLYSGSF
jgi:hypothetical protein